jgi:hypothetical protein
MWVQVGQEENKGQEEKEKSKEEEIACPRISQRVPARLALMLRRKR